MNPSVRCGLNSNLRQIRPILDFESQIYSAIDVRDQCVESDVDCSRALVMTSSTWSSRIDGGALGRGS